LDQSLKSYKHPYSMILHFNPNLFAASVLRE
jgi:hypothetical protein